MNKDKYIEEMAEEISEVTEARELITDRYGNAYGYRRVGVSDPKQIAEHLIENKGYRKASDLAREIFEEIEGNISHIVNHKFIECQRHHEHNSYTLMLQAQISVLRILLNYIAELKKKYTESEKE